MPLMDLNQDLCAEQSRFSRIPALRRLNLEILDEKAEKFLTPENLEMLEKFANVAQAQEAWDHEILEQTARDFAEAEDLKLGKVAQPLRAKLTGRTISPSVFEVMELLGKEESLKRLRAVL